VGGKCRGLWGGSPRKGGKLTNSNPCFKKPDGGPIPAEKIEGRPQKQSGFSHSDRKRAKGPFLPGVRGPRPIEWKEGPEDNFVVLYESSNQRDWPEIRSCEPKPKGTRESGDARDSDLSKQITAEQGVKGGKKRQGRNLPRVGKKPSKKGRNWGDDG